MGSQLLSTVERREVLPESYIRPESDRPRLAEVTTDSNVPLIDLASPDKQRVIAEIGLACRTYGFFQVTASHALIVLTRFSSGTELQRSKTWRLNFFGGFRMCASPLVNL
jgi:hypothetical protein